MATQDPAVDGGGDLASPRTDGPPAPSGVKPEPDATPARQGGSLGPSQIARITDAGRVTLVELRDALAALDAQRAEIIHARDALIVELSGRPWQGGATYAQLGDWSGMTQGNVWQIINRARRESLAARKAAAK